MIRATFDRDRVDVVVGGLELAKAFTTRALGPPALHRQPGDRPRDREGGSRAARAGHARAGRQVPGDPRPRTASTPSRSSRCSARRRSRTGRCASRSTTAWCRASSWRSSPRLAAEHVRETMPGYCASESCTGIITDAPPGANRGAARGRARSAAATCGRSRRRGERRSGRAPAADVARDRPARRPRR